MSSAELLYLPFAQVIIPERQRTELDEKELRALEDDIIAHGLYHPILVHQTPKGYELVAGFRRLTAIRNLTARGQTYRCHQVQATFGTVPCTLTHMTGGSALALMEFNENERRQGLSMWDKQAALVKIHKLLESENPTPEKRHTMTATAEVLHEAQPEKKKTTLLHEVADANLIERYRTHPDVKRAPSLQKAAAVARRVQDEEARVRYAGSLAPRQELLTEDCREVFKSWLAAGAPRFDAIIVDPPYGVNAGKFGTFTGRGHAYDDSAESAFTLATEIITAGYQLLRETGVLFMFCDVETFVLLRDHATSVGFQPTRTPLVWAKDNGILPDPSAFRRTYELILYCRKGLKPLRKPEDDVMHFAPVQHKTHSAQKPVELYTHLLDLTCGPGTIVLDPCCGSGTIFAAAKATQRTAYGIELDPTYAAAARAELEK